MSDKYETAISNNNLPVALFNDNKDQSNTNINEDYLPIEPNLIKLIKSKGDKVYPVYNISGLVHDGKYPKPITEPFQSVFLGTAVVDLDYLLEIFQNEDGEIKFLYDNMKNSYDVITTDYWFDNFRYRNNQLNFSKEHTINFIKSKYPVSIGAIIETDFYEKYGKYITEDFQFNIGNLTKDEFNQMQDEILYKYSIRYSTNPNFLEDYIMNFDDNYAGNGNRYTDFRAFSGKYSMGENEYNLSDFKIRYFKEDYDANRVVLTLEQFNQVFGTDYQDRLEVDLEKYSDMEFEIEFQVYENDTRYYYKDSFKLNRIAINQTDNFMHFSSKNTDVLEVLLQPYALLLPPSSSTNFLTNVKKGDLLIYNSDLAIYNAVSGVVSTFTGVFNYLRILLILVTLVIIIVLALNSMRRNNKFVSIMKCFGMRRLDLVKVFLTQTLINTALIIIFIVGGTLVGTKLANSILEIGISKFLKFDIIGLDIIVINWKTTILYLLITIITFISSIIIPIIRVKYINPIVMLK